MKAKNSTGFADLLDLHKLKGVTKTSSLRLFKEMEEVDLSYMLGDEPTATAATELDSAVIDALESEVSDAE